MKTILALSVLVIITTPYCYSAAIEDTATDNTDTTNNGVAGGTAAGMDIDIADVQTVNIIRENTNCGDDSKGARGTQGPRGEKGEQGPPGPPGVGGALYTRWGRTVCPNTNGTELVYKGLMAGTYFSYYGGGANYLCLTKDIKYLTTSTASSYSTLYAAEYETPVKSSLYEDNAPCAVCHTSKRSSKLMIPGTTVCPTSWTEEYEGYLMTAHSSHSHNYVFECVDKDAEPVPGTSSSTNGALLYHVGGVCNVGLPCPPMVANRPLTCVVCTK